MSELKTKQTSESVADFLAAVEDPTKRQDAQIICNLMADITKEPPKMWGTSIVGFDKYTYHYATGKSGDWPIVGFSPRKQNLTIYINEGYDGHQDLLKKLGKHSTGKSCLYIKRLADIDQNVLRELITRSVAHMRKAHK